jgi:hypothetical protein
VPKDDSLLKMTVAATVLGWKVPVAEPDWPESFERDGQTWQKDHMTVAANGEVQCAEYTAGDGEWVIIYDE